MQQKNDPIKKKEDVPEHTDNKIDQDFPGFPYGQSTEKLINPKTEADKKTAALNSKDGEKRENKPADEADSDGSGGAFEATETSSQEED